MSRISSSLPGEFLGHSHCCPIPWIPHDNKVERASVVSAWGVGSPEALLLPLLSAPASATLSSPVLSHRAPQHGRIDAENEPSPRHGAHGSRPTGKPVCLSVCPSPWPSVCPRLLSSFHSVSVFPRRSARRGEKGKGVTRSPVAVSVQGWARPTQNQEQSPQ